jgi:hypothetical protein
VRDSLKHPTAGAAGDRAGALPPRRRCTRSQAISAVWAESACAGEP